MPWVTSSVLAAQRTRLPNSRRSHSHLYRLLWITNLSTLQTH